MKFRLSFSSSPLDTEYREVKRAYMKAFFKFLIYILLILSGIGIVQNIILGSLSGFIRMAVIFLLCAVVLKYGHKMERSSDCLLAILSYILYLSGIQSTGDAFTLSRDSVFFYRGYVYGVFERLVIFQLARIELKVIFSVASLVLRVVMCEPPNTFTLCYQILMWALSLLADIRRENSDRAIFKGIYQKSEELTKFKNLMVFGLPTNILILARNRQTGLFSNECFQTTFKVDGLNEDWQVWLRSFIIESDSLDDRSRNLIGEELNGELTMSRFLEILDTVELKLDRGQNFSFNTKYGVMEDNSEEKVLETKVFPLIWDGKDAVAIIMNDVTQQYMNLTLRVANANKDKMIAMVSHEFRTPLNGILGMIHIIEKTIRNNEILGYIRVCKVNGQLLLNLVNSILDLSQVRNNKLTLKISKFKLTELLQDMQLLFEFQFKQKNLYFEVTTDPNVPIDIVTDVNRLRQILINLIGNALKFTFKGGARLYVGLDEENKDNLFFRISDTGIGIKKEDKKKLFQMYGRLDQSDNINMEGVGLGLTISEHLVRFLSNNPEEPGIKVESTIREGTTFSFSIKASHNAWIDLSGYDRYDFRSVEESAFAEGDLNVAKRVSEYILEPRSGELPSNFAPNLKVPCQSDTNPSIVKELSEHEGEAVFVKSQEKAQILLVDDSPFNIMVAQHLVETLGYEVQTALNGEIAVNKVKEAAARGVGFKIVFMDCQMPVMDGYEATSVLRKLMKDGEVMETPIVALSANDSDEDKRRCREVGMCDHLVKPVSEASLKEIIKKYGK